MLLGAGSRANVRAVTRCFLIPPAEYAERNDARLAALHALQAKLEPLPWEEQCKLPEVAALFHAQYFGAGAMWFCPWYYDPAAPDPEERRGKPGILSVYYWRDWADTRPPLMVVTPALREWCVDQKASNGEGWTVTGHAPRITCSPSIDVPGYHGYLRDGEFSPPL